MINLRDVKEKLETEKKVDFSATRKTMNLVKQLDILADALYIEVNVLNGYSNKLFIESVSKEIISGTDVWIVKSLISGNNTFFTWPCCSKNRIALLTGLVTTQSSQPTYSV